MGVSTSIRYSAANVNCTGVQVCNGRPGPLAQSATNARCGIVLAGIQSLSVGMRVYFSPSGGFLENYSALDFAVGPGLIRCVLPHVRASWERQLRHGKNRHRYGNCDRIPLGESTRLAQSRRQG